MLSKKDYINYWKELAEDDWEAVNALLNAKKYLQSLFFAHLVLEKLSKAIWIKYNKTNIPPKTHNLAFIISQTPLKLSDDQAEFILNMNRFQLEGRYPEYITKINKICDEKFTKEMLERIKSFKSWLTESLQ